MDDRAVTIRQAEAADVGAITALTDDAFRHPARLPGKPTLIVLEAYGPRIACGQIWLLRKSGGLRGVLELHPGHALIYSIAVAFAHQSEGHGGQLLDWAEARTRSAGLGEVRLYTNGSADGSRTFWGLGSNGTENLCKGWHVTLRGACRRTLGVARRLRAAWASSHRCAMVRCQPWYLPHPGYEE